MASPPPTPRNAKHYILAGLMAILAAAVVVTVFFVVLSPARIYFSVTFAKLEDDGVGDVVLSLTLAANNTSQRASVKYQTLFVDVTNNTGSEVLFWVKANMNRTDKSRWYTHGSVATEYATASLLPFFSSGGYNAGSALSLAVKVTAAARFKVAGIPTRLYDISVTCGPITLVGRSRTAPPVGCSPV